MQGDDDYEWEPPSEAEMKIIQARRERSDKISKLMGDYLLKGYKMLGITCPTCDTILLQYKEEDSDTPVNYCVACQELDTDTNKDDPVLNLAAARTQMREATVADMADCDDDLSYMRRVSSHQPPTHRTQQTVTQSAAQRNNMVSSTTLTMTETGPHPAMSFKQLNKEFHETTLILCEKIQWATEELKKSTSVEYNITLCQMIKSASDALHSLKLIA